MKRSSCVSCHLLQFYAYFLMQEIDAADMQALDAFLPPSSSAKKTLADLIFEKFDSGEIEAGGKVKVAVEDEGKARSWCV